MVNASERSASLLIDCGFHSFHGQFPLQMDGQSVHMGVAVKTTRIVIYIHIHILYIYI